MKKVSCKSVQGPDDCAHVFMCVDFDDFMKQAKEHFGSVHADMVKDVSDEDREKWSSMAKEVVENTPDE